MSYGGEGQGPEVAWPPPFDPAPILFRFQVAHLLLNAYLIGNPIIPIRDRNVSPGGRL